MFHSQTPRTRARQALLSSTASRSWVRFMLVASMTLSSHLVFCRPLLLLPSLFPNMRVFSRESSLLMRWTKSWSLSFRICPFSEHSGLISFRMDRFVLLAVHGTLKSLLQQFKSIKSLTFFMVQLSRPYITTGKTIALTMQTFLGKVMSLLSKMLSRFVIIFSFGSIDFQGRHSTRVSTSLDGNSQKGMFCLRKLHLSSESHVWPLPWLTGRSYWHGLWLPKSPR